MTDPTKPKDPANGMSPAQSAPISVALARSRILDRISPVDVEDVALVDAACRVLAGDRKAMRAVPAFDNSAMDGVGVRTADVARATKEQPVELRVVGEALPGGLPPRALGEGEAVRIMTGAPVPPGVDAIVMRELTDESRIGEGLVRVLEAAPLGQHVRHRGEDVNEGDLIVRAGDVVTPARMNAALCAGIVHLMVHRRPVVAILASGDELREIGEELDDASSPRTIPNSNAPAIAALARAAGCEVRLLGIAGDSLDDHVAKMRLGLEADALVTIGGVSMGTHDFVRPALEKLGGTLEMWRVAMRPGKPIAFGRISRADRISLPIFGLPGNPVSAHVAAELFLRPALEKLGGARAIVRPLWRAVLDAPFTKKHGLEHWARAEATLVDGALQVRVLDKQGSHHIAALAQANALVRFGVDVERVDAGASVEVLMLDEPASGRPRMVH